MMHSSFSELDLLLSHSYHANNPVMIDVGAGQGDTALPFASMNWQVIAFEPERHNFQICQNTLKPYKNAKVKKYAISDTDNDEVKFYVSQKHFGIHSLIPFHSTHKIEYSVKTMRLDNYLSKAKIPEVTLLKIDTEGADFLVLKSFNFNYYHPEIVMVEFMDSRTQPFYQYGYTDMIKYMSKYGYTALVSEWDEIIEYGRQGISTPPHRWKKIVPPFLITGKPSWGNLIFIRKDVRISFFKTLIRYFFRTLIK